MTELRVDRGGQKLALRLERLCLLAGLSMTKKSLV
jgi:hypothetical protein